LLLFEHKNILGADNYPEYKDTADFKKLMKISKEYHERYHVELNASWNKSTCAFTTEETDNMIVVFTKNLEYAVKEMISPEIEVGRHSEDIIILDYLITCRQLI
jgi:hypothetical protein